MALLAVEFTSLQEQQMQVVTRVKLLMHTTRIGVGAAVFSLAGWFLKPERQQFYAGWFLLCLVLAILGYILRNYVVKNATASERKTLRGAGLIT